MPLQGPRNALPAQGMVGVGRDGVNELQVSMYPDQQWIKQHWPRSMRVSRLMSTMRRMSAGG